MAPKVRVYELAKELNVSSEHVIADLRAIGEFVRSATSILEPAVVRRLHEHRAATETAPSGRPDAPPSYIRSNPFAPAQFPRPRPRVIFADPTAEAARRKSIDWYRGPKPAQLVQFLLDDYFVPRRNERQRKMPKNKYLVREVEQATQMSGEWAPALLAGWSFEDIGTWVPSGLAVDQAIKAKAEGIGPTELGWSYEDHDRGTLAYRLRVGAMTLDEVILEAQGRRTRA